MKKIIRNILREEYIISESQKFNFEEYKEGIIKFIQAVRRGEEQYRFTPFYTLITNSFGGMGGSNKIGFTDEQKSKWKTGFQSPPFHSNGVWSQMDFNPGLTRKLGKDVTLNYYITINKEKDNIIKFVNSLNDLIKSLHQLSNDKQTPISFKTHTILDAFVQHNDSLKIYFYDSELRHDIEKLVNGWVKRNGLQTADRTHHHGVDKSMAPGGDKQSYGQLLADNVAKQLANVVKQNGNKYTDEQYYGWVKKYMPDIIKKTSIKY